MEITEENVEEVTQTISNVVEEITEVEEEQTTENLNVVIDVITDTTVIVGNDTTIATDVSSLVDFRAYMHNITCILIYIFR